MLTITLVILPLVSIMLFWLLFKNRPKKHEKLLIRRHNYQRSSVKKEQTYTLISLLVFAVIGAFLDTAFRRGYTRIYTDISDYSSVYFVASFFLALGINDVYFYITHRLLHSKLLYKRVHFRHHRSFDPNPWSSFSFHPLEAVIQIGIVPLVAVLIPIHLYALISFTAFMLLMSVYGHCGYELRPNKKKAFSIFNNSIHHNQHHQFFNYNFGLYLNIWDKWFKTNHPTYLKQTENFRSNTAKKKVR